MDLITKYPLVQGEIEIEVPKGVTGLIVVTLKTNETVLVSVRNGVISVDESVAEHFLAGNNGQPLPGYKKFVVNADINGQAETSTGPTDIPTIDEVKTYLTEKGVKFHQKLGADKLQALYAAEKVKEIAEGKTLEPTDGKLEASPLTLENYAATTLDGLKAALPAIEDVEFVKSLIAAEANGEARQEFLDATEARLAELTV